MPKPAPIPVRRAEILATAEQIRPIVRGRSIEEVARLANIILTFFNDPHIAIGGYATILYSDEPLYIESLAREGGLVELLGESRRVAHRAIVINRGFGLSDAEVFWHEFYHLYFSPESRNIQGDYSHVYSTLGVLHNQEERRANEFAAALLIDHVDPGVNISDIMCQYNVSRTVASLRMGHHDRQSGARA